MQLVVRTYDEVSDDRVRIEMSPGQTLEIALVPTASFEDNSEYNPGYDLVKMRGALTLAQKSREFNRTKFLAEEKARLLAEQRLEKAETELTSYRESLTAQIAEIEELESAAKMLEVKIEELEQKVREYDLDRHTERDRADKANNDLARARNQVALKTAKLWRIGKLINAFAASSTQNQADSTSISSVVQEIQGIVAAPAE